MLKQLNRTALVAVLLSGVAIPALGADMVEPIPAPPMQMEPAVVPVSTSGWYIRGDVDYHWADFIGARYVTYGPPPGNNTFATGDLRGTWSLGGGIGNQVNDHFRVDFTGDYWFKSDFEGTTVGTCGGVPCSSVDIADMSAVVLLANAYVDLGTYYKITPYVGAGIGGAYVQWGDLRNTVGGITTTHHGRFSWRFAAAVMVGASYCLTDNLDLDAGYRFTHIDEGPMFNYANGAGPGQDEGFNVHEVRAGVRWRFGDSAPRPGCGPQYVAYEPEPVAPVYK